jgi:hypothetical protein
MIDPPDSMTTDCTPKIPREEKNTGSPQIPVSLMPRTSFPIYDRLRSSPTHFLSEWQVILVPH